MRVSFSSLETYRNCPLKFKYQELDKIKTPKAIEAIFGNTIHSSLKKLFQKTPLFPTLDEILNDFNNKWRQSFEKMDEEKKDENVFKAYLEEGVSMLKNFYKKNPPWNFNVVELESRFEVIIEDSAGNESHILAGVMDRVDKNPENDEYEIIDYKTSKRMPSQDDLDKNLQLSIYNLGLLKKWPHLAPEKIKLSLYFLKHGEKIESKRTKEELERTKNEILKIIREIQKLLKEEKEFMPIPSVLCDWCGYKQACPMWRHLYKTDSKPPTTQNDIEGLINEYFELENQTGQNKCRVSQIKARISDFMDQESVSRVFADKGYLTRILQEREAFDSQKAKKILENIGRLAEAMSKKQYSTLRATKNKNKV